MSEQQIAESTETKFEKLFSAIIFTLVIIVAFWFRFHQISIKPFHHDEGVNSYFLLNLASSGEYKYDPVNYHGPTLYYLALIALRVFGENDLALRFWPALFGALTVAMLWSLRHHLGTIGTPVAAVCMALSPGLVYYSRDFIHEMLFGCFSLGIVVGAWRYAETKKFIWLVMLSYSVGLLFTTKETAIINTAVLIIAIICAAVWDITRKLMRQNRFSFAETVGELKSDLASVLPSLDHSLAALMIFVSIYIFLYSSLFSHWQGLTDFFKSIWLWASERSNKDHVHPFYYYIAGL
ncbi:MAG: TIGR03663 family protein, partial [Acidobacteria bacterium]|nr:TIGR03663 family protein [Acidobacteriota bacterium]